MVRTDWKLVGQVDNINLSNFSKCANLKNDLKWKKIDEMCDVTTENTDSLRQLAMCVTA